VANGKKRKNTVFSPQDGENEIEGDENLMKHATLYYKNLFGPSDCPNLSLDPSCWKEEEKITAAENELLKRDFSKE
jgi:hypothetical protein